MLSARCKPSLTSWSAGGAKTGTDIFAIVYFDTKLKGNFSIARSKMAPEFDIIKFGVGSVKILLN
jgi:hypothetical protein